MKAIPSLLALLAALAFASAASAAEPKAEAPNPSAKPDSPAEQTVVTTHTVTIDGQVVHYKATAGTIVTQAENKGKLEPKASVFYIAYTRTDDATTATRPVTFSFNGGPGSSSVWLHLGMLGPRRVALGDDGQPAGPPYHLQDNPYSLLDKTDLVFIDPVSTGFSRPAPGEDPGQFHGVQEDIHSVGEFIRVWTTRNNRWESPKFLIGESYGTTRAAGLAGYLQDDLGMYLNGIMLVSSVLDFQTISFDTGNDLPYVLYLPSYAAAAWYHKKLPADLQDQSLAAVVAAAEQFTRDDYMPALFKGDALGDADRARIAAGVARLTGLTADYVLHSGLRVPPWRFEKVLLRDEDRTIGRYDARYTGIDRESEGEAPDYDPSYSALQGAFTATLNSYLRGELNYKSDLPYEILTGRVQPWKWGTGGNGYVDLGETLRAAISYNPALHVFVACGRYDLATPLFASIYTFQHLGLAPEQRKNVEMKFYDAGHMIYVVRPELEKLRKDLVGFIGQAVPGS